MEAMVVVVGVVRCVADEPVDVGCEGRGRGRSRWSEAVETRNYKGRTVAGRSGCARSGLL
jgi:hypothetical protein